MITSLKKLQEIAERYGDDVRGATYPLPSTPARLLGLSYCQREEMVSTLEKLKQDCADFRADTFPRRTQAMVSTLMKLEQIRLMLWASKHEKIKIVLIAGTQHLETKGKDVEDNRYSLVSLYEQLNNHKAVILLPTGNKDYATDYRKRIEWLKAQESNKAQTMTQEKTAAVNVPCDVGFSNTLGVRSELSWNTTVAFTWTSQGWAGHIPLGKEFKFVIALENGEIIWEKRKENRVLNLNGQFSTIDLGEIQF